MLRLGLKDQRLKLLPLEHPSFVSRVNFQYCTVKVIDDIYPFYLWGLYTSVCVY